MERLVYTGSSKLLAMSFDLPKPLLNSSIQKIIWNLRITKQSTIGCTPFEKHFNRTANTRWKNRISFNNRLDKGKWRARNWRARNWELHDGAEDGYLNANMDTQSDPEKNLPLALTIPSTPVPEVHIPGKGALVSGGKYYRTATTIKNRALYFNLVKEDIIDSSEHTITLDKGHILRKSDLAFKGKLLPGPRKIAVYQSPIGHNITLHSSLAGKRKLSPPKKTKVTDHSQPRQGTSRADGPTQVSGSSKDAANTHDLTQNTSGSSSFRHP